MKDKKYYADKIFDRVGWKTNLARFKVVRDTSDWMAINRGDVMIFGDGEYLIKGNMREPRFGIDEQPKMWVFNAVDLDTGDEKIIKTLFNEEFYAHIGILKIRCYRSPDKESAVLDSVRGDSRFMQGETFYDEEGNNVRVIDYIKGESFFRYVYSIEKDHKTYFIEDLPRILRNIRTTIEAILRLHELGYCHGDIRNDHIFIEGKTGDYRWIDFDLKQDVTDFDLWSLGNIISYAVAKGILTFKSVLKSPDFSDDVKASLTQNDASAFYNYRIMNLQKAYRYVPFRMAKILRRFTIKPPEFYTSVEELLDDFNESLDREFNF